MRSPLRRTAALLFAAAALAGSTAPASPVAAAAAPAAPAGPRHAECRTRVHGSHATADCFNGNATTDHVQLHVECVRWWDPDMDTARAAVGPAGHVSLTQRCWLGIRHAWVTHRAT
ncbi:hypothetical protein [Streptomyces roseoverticillatus]|uniref:hypothetical protein n=1 Tax=Streptomyces roseoverticillatus TaxID=66429 RepID=UPI0004C0B27D|nr:hypothetical protein [Streptomyces roseoverticillatus]